MGQWAGLGAVGGAEGGAEGQWVGLGCSGRAGAHLERRGPGGAGTRGILRTKRAGGNGRASGPWRLLRRTRAAAELQKHTCTASPHQQQQHCCRP